jgi:hypothetical protein
MEAAFSSFVAKVAQFHFFTVNIIQSRGDVPHSTGAQEIEFLERHLWHEKSLFMR